MYSVVILNLLTKWLVCMLLFNTILIGPCKAMPINKYEEERRNNIKRNIARMGSLGIGHVKNILDEMGRGKKDDYRTVPSKKNNSEESTSDYDPLEDDTNQSDESDDSLGEEDEMPVTANISSRFKVVTYSCKL